MTPLLEKLGELLRYPDQQYARHLQEAVNVAEGECRAELERFENRTSGLSLGELQELYTQTFDLSPLCSLEVGWQLYGEDYARGSFLVYMRSQLSEYGTDEREELPDHLSHVLPSIARMPRDKSDELREGAALPAIEKMLQAFEGKRNPYADLLNAVRIALKVAVEPVEEASHV
jgi:nitrate reductase assembly molybdenum cofactor insertion protein NarJ